jgi:hypothetical protein
MATLLASLQHSKLVRTRVPGSTTMYQVVYTRVRTYVGYYELGWDRNQAADQRVHAVVVANIHENDDSSRGSNGSRQPRTGVSARTACCTVAPRKGGGSPDTATRDAFLALAAAALISLLSSAHLTCTTLLPCTSLLLLPLLLLLWWCTGVNMSRRLSCDGMGSVTKESVTLARSSWQYTQRTV